MPTTVGHRYDHIKVYRPNGMRFATGHGLTPEIAVSTAMILFQHEFGVLCQEQAVIEVVGVTGSWAATVYEIPDLHQEEKHGTSKT